MIGQGQQGLLAQLMARQQAQQQAQRQALTSPYGMGQRPGQPSRMVRGFADGGFIEEGEYQQLPDYMSSGEVPFVTQQLVQPGGQFTGQFAAPPQTYMQATAPAPVAPAVPGGNQEEWRNRQTGLADLLLAQAMGQGTTAAQGQLQQATDANIRQAMALGQSQAGASPMAAYRAIAENQARAQQEAAGQSSVLRAQESQAAMGQLGNLLGGARAQDIGVYESAADRELRAADLELKRVQLRQAIADGNWDKAVQLTNAISMGTSNVLTAGAKYTQEGGGGAGGAPAGGGGGAAPIGTGGGGKGPMAHGGLIGGYAQGGMTDSAANDTVPAMLSPGEIVLPKSVANDQDAAAKAAAFVEAIKRRQQMARPMGMPMAGVR